MAVLTTDNDLVAGRSRRAQPLTCCHADRPPSDKPPPQRVMIATGPVPRCDRHGVLGRLRRSTRNHTHATVQPNSMNRPSLPERMFPQGNGRSLSSSMGGRQDAQALVLFVRSNLIRFR